MYRHCHAKEDKDMTPFDFITDHLVNIDGLFDKHDNGDDQKSHSPSPAQHHGQANFTLISYFSLSLTNFYTVKVKPSIPLVTFFPSNYIPSIFRPPMVA